MRVKLLLLSSLVMVPLTGCSNTSSPSPGPRLGAGGYPGTGGTNNFGTGGTVGSTGGQAATGGVKSTGGSSTGTVGGTRANDSGGAATGGYVADATGGATLTGGSNSGSSTGGGPSVDTCVDTPRTSESCSDAKSYGFCGQSWFGDYCQVTCGTCGTSVGTGGATGTGGKTGTGGMGVGGSSSATGGTATTGGGTANTGGGTATATGGVPNAGGAATACGYKPVPNSANTTNFDAGAWYTSWKSKFYVDCGNGMARIANGQGSSNTVSEGIGYGMLLAVGNSDRTALDALWAFYKGHVDVNGLMNWSVNNCAAQTPGSQDNFAATDGDEDAAMALVQADAKWGGYATDAKSLIGLIKKFETSQTTTPTYLRPGDAANNGGKGEGIVNPSYFAPGYWHAWATYTGDTSWNKLATDAYVMLAQFQTLTISSSTGALVPDWGNSAGQNPYGGAYYYDACRTPWRVAVDYVWFCTAAAQTFLKNVSTYVDGKGGVASVPFDKNSAFFGPFALSGMAVSQDKATAYLNGWLSAQMDDTPYFQGSLRGVFLLLANMNFPSGT